jgi:hypothetical protein
VSTASQSGSRRITSSAAAEWSTLAGVGAFLAFLYWATDAPLYNPVGFVDPWLYTSLFGNFDWAYSIFSDTYYAARLPWVIPGYVLHSVLPARAAYFLLHACFFYGGGLFAYLLVRRYVGRAGALAAFAFLLGTQLYYISESWNYFDGAIVTFMLAAFSFCLTRAAGRRRNVHMALGGVFTAAAVFTNIFVVVLAVGIPALYLWLNGRELTRRAGPDDLGAFFIGAFALGLVCGLFAVVKGGAFLFWLPQIRSANRLVGSSEFATHSWDWVPNNPRLWAPAFIAFVAAAACAWTRDRRDLVWRFTLGSAIYAAASEAFMLLWDLTLNGSTLQSTYYFSLLLTSMTMCIGGVVGLLLHTVPEGRRASVALIASAVAVATPLMAIYLDDEGALTGRSGTWITAAAAATALLVVAVTLANRSRRAPSLMAVLAGAAVLGTPAFAIDSSADVFDYSRSNSARGDVYRLGMKLIDYLRTTGIQENGRRGLFFWYHGYDHGVPNFRVGLQSLYFYAGTYIGTKMPQVDRELRYRMKYFVPANAHLVLLCEERECSGGPIALHRAGYRLASRSERLLSSGHTHVWVHVLSVKIGAHP